MNTRVCMITTIVVVKYIIFIHIIIIFYAYNNLNARINRSRRRSHALISLIHSRTVVWIVCCVSLHARRRFEFNLLHLHIAPIPSTTYGCIIQTFFDSLWVVRPNTIRGLFFDFTSYVVTMGITLKVFPYRLQAFIITARPEEIEMKNVAARRHAVYSYYREELES